MIIVTLTGLAFLLGGFAIGRVAGGDGTRASFGTLPGDLSTQSKPDRVPAFRPARAVPSLETTVPTQTIDEGAYAPDEYPETTVEYEPAYEPAPVESKSYVPPPATSQPAPTPEVTVGKSE